MKVIQPVIFQTSQLHSTTAVETYSTYAAGTTYAIGNKVVYGTRIYESLVNANLGNQPDTNSTKWLALPLQIVMLALIILLVLKPRVLLQW